jgi:uncharacterized protein
MEVNSITPTMPRPLSVMSDKTQETNELPWYAQGLAFECTQCGNCCSGPQTGFVWVDDNEIQALAIAMGMQDDLEGFERKFTRRVGQKTSLVEYSDGDCIFLHPTTRNCTVYDARPRQCRTWPFWDITLESPKAWKKTAKECPGCNQGRLYSLVEIQQRLE